MFSGEVMFFPWGEKATVLKDLIHFAMKRFSFLSFKWTEPTESVNSRNLELLKLLKELFLFNQAGAVVVSRKAKIWKFKML